MAKRITPAEVLAAYQATGRKPGRGLCFGSDGTSCAIGVLYLLAQGTTRGDPYAWAEREYGSKYPSCFVLGFDGSVRLDWLANTEGYADGKACAAAVFGEEKA